MRQAVVVLLPKKKSDTGAPIARDSRPISLLTTDCKIFAKLLAKHLDGVLGVVVGWHHTYGLKSRTIATNAHVMRDISEAAVALQRPITVLQVDLSEAFDKVSHFFIFSMPKACGVGEMIRIYVKIFYRDISTRLLVNGYRSRAIPVERTARQGYPMSPVLFACTRNFLVDP